jgi:uncharacterized protein YecE (DUF72 family)
MSTVYLGTAGWSIPRLFADQFPEGDSHLARYAKRFTAVEINTSFYRLHQPSTYARWADTTPPDFRFVVKLPLQITHRSRLQDVVVLDEFLYGVHHLAEKLGGLLVQLPPGLAFDQHMVQPFFATLRRRYQGLVVCEPRHITWFGDIPDRLMADFAVVRAAVDPAPLPAAAEPGGWQDVIYYRLHGSPRVYVSSYPADFLQGLAARLSDSQAPDTWCMFNNTGSFAATANALDLARLLYSSSVS